MTKSKKKKINIKLIVIVIVSALVIDGVLASGFLTNWGHDWVSNNTCTTYKTCTTNQCLKSSGTATSDIKYMNNITNQLKKTFENYHPLFNKRNICVYFSSIDNIVSKKRRQNITYQLNKIGINYEYDNGVTNGSNIERMFKHLLIKMERFKYSNYKYGLICDDDFIPCDNFWTKITNTMKYIKPKFRCLHLCPGCLWGRKFRNENLLGHLNSEKNLLGLKHNKYVFYDIDKNIWVKRSMWLGGPIAFIINKGSIDSLIHDYKLFWKKNKVPNDVILLNIINTDDYVCREPQFGYEKEEGGSTFKF